MATAREWRGLRAVSITLGICIFGLGAALALYLLQAVFPAGLPGGALSSVAGLLYGAYGFSAFLVPCYLLYAAILLLIPGWTVRAGLVLAGSIFPFFTAVGGERMLRALAESYAGTSVAAGILGGIAACALFAVLAEYVILLWIADRLAAPPREYAAVSPLDDWPEHPSLDDDEGDFSPEFGLAGDFAPEAEPETPATPDGADHAAGSAPVAADEPAARAVPGPVAIDADRAAVPGRGEPVPTPDIANARAEANPPVTPQKPAQPKQAVRERASVTPAATGSDPEFYHLVPEGEAPGKKTEDAPTYVDFERMKAPFDLPVVDDWVDTDEAASPDADADSESDEAQILDDLLANEGLEDGFTADAVIEDEPESEPVTPGYVGAEWPAVPDGHAADGNGTAAAMAATYPAATAVAIEAGKPAVNASLRPDNQVFEVSFEDLADYDDPTEFEDLDEPTAVDAASEDFDVDMINVDFSGDPEVGDAVADDIPEALGDGEVSEADVAEDADIDDFTLDDIDAVADAPDEMGAEIAGDEIVDDEIADEEEDEVEDEDLPLPETIDVPVSRLAPRRPSRRNYDVPFDILNTYPDGEYWVIDDATRRAASALKETLNEFRIQADVTGIRKGPVITMFEILPAPGVKLSKIVGLQDNIALRLAASSVRIVAPIPGKHAVGIEVPNQRRALVSFRELIESDTPAAKKMEIPVILGKDITGEAQLLDLATTPHLLIAGSTGAGKSVCVNSIILSILYKRSPDEVKLILIDPKIVELKLYNDIGHLLAPVITEPKKAFQSLQYCLCEMERRYALLDGMGVRDIKSYNRRIIERNIATEKLPYLVVIIDEFADLMATTGKELESTVARLCAMSRAVGIHLVLATQRPSIDVITGLIKANIPSRIAFMVASKMDSRIIIDQVGAEKLLGRGDMLYASATDPFPTRIQGAFVSEEEVERVVEHVKTLGEPEYIDEEIFVDDEDDEELDQSLFSDGEDPLYDKALEIVLNAGKASASYIQRKLKIGYNRAARLVEDMEARGIVGPANGSKPREVVHRP